MGAASARSQEFDISIRAGGQRWSAEAVARDPRHLRAQVALSQEGALPSWSPDTVIAFSPLGAPRKEARARVTRQVGSTVWMEVLALDTPALRIAQGGGKGCALSVGYRVEGQTGIGYGNRLTASGLHLKTPHTIDPTVPLAIRLVLPGEALPVSLESVALSERVTISGQHWTRLKFVRLPVEMGQRLDEAVALRKRSA